MRDKAGSVFYYTLPESDAKTAAPEVAEPAQPVKPAVQEPVPQKATVSMDQLAAGNSSLIPLTPKLVTVEIRRTKNRLAQLEKLRVTVRVQARLQRSLGL